MLQLFNTATRRLQNFRPIKPAVRMYTCGPTVYAPAHLGNFRSYIFADILKRTLEYNHWRVKQVMNITDVGHLTGDSDDGDDKIARAAREQRKTAWDIATEYTELFLDDAAKLNIEPPTHLVKATDHIKEQIALVRLLERKGFTYKTSDGIYFDTAKFPAYGKFAHLDVKGLRGGERIAVGEKRNKTDFALWKFSPAGAKREMEWPSPWGVGFPGWHIECSALARKYLGQPFDIHTGGIDHINIHHTNEVAQSVAAYGKPLAHFWLHNDFLVFPAVAGSKRMGKSERNIITVADVIARGLDPLSYRYLCLTTHYRKKLEFSWDALQAADTGLKNLRELAINPPLTHSTSSGQVIRGVRGSYNSGLDKKFLSALNNDLDTPQALAWVWKVAKSADPKKQDLLKAFDRVLGLNLFVKEKSVKIPPAVQALVQQREQARLTRDWTKADTLRKKITAAGFTVQDTAEGPKIKIIKP